MILLRRVKLTVLAGVICLGLFKLYHLHKDNHLKMFQAFSLRFYPLTTIKSQRLLHQIMNTTDQYKIQPVVTKEHDKITPDVTKEHDNIKPDVTHEGNKLTPDVTKERDIIQSDVTQGERDKIQPDILQEYDKIQRDVTQERDKITPDVTEEPASFKKHVQDATEGTQKQDTTSLLRNSFLEVIRKESIPPSTDKYKVENLKYTPTKGALTYPPSSGQNACNLPNLNPWDLSINHLLKDVGFDPKCRPNVQRFLCDVIDNRLVLRDNSNKNHVFTLETIHRRENTDDSYIIRLEDFKTDDSSDGVHKSKQVLGSDFFRISYSLNEHSKRTHYYARVVPQKDVLEKSKIQSQGDSFSKKGLPLNVLMLGIDSTSNANFVRKMPHTMEWLRTEMHSFVMKGYSIVGDATTPALTAMLTGKQEASLPGGRKGSLKSKPLDQWPWISKLYEKRGYATLFAEDDPEMGTFNLRLKGFSQPPFHHYMRPFWLAIEDNGMRDKPGICSREVSLVNYTMDYLVSFFEAYKDTPKFAMGFLSYLTHAHPNHLSYGDLDILYMLKRMKSRGYLDKTLLIIFGDHGSRNDNIRNTMQGKLEERLPWLSISVPDWLRFKHPEFTAALALNEQIICSPFDLHTTLRHVLTHPQIPKAGSYHSFFTRLPHDRTCKDAGIDEHWCPCLHFMPADSQSQIVNRSAQAVVEHINNRLSSSDRLKSACHVIRLTKVHNVVKYEPNQKVQTFHSTNQRVYNSGPKYGPRTADDLHYLITIETSPMGALFEASVTITSNKAVIVNPNISRTNLYGDQPKCIARTHPYLKKFCVCRT